MIPKIIHYCWFGKGKKPRLARKCIASWHRLLSDYEIREWNEDTFDLSKYPYAAYCLQEGKYAFLSDYVRLLVVYEHGGIYFDTDVEVIKNPDHLLEYEAFYGFEDTKHINTGLGFGAQKKHKTVSQMLDEYRNIRPDTAGNYPITGCPTLNTRALVKMGLQLNGERQNIYGAEILPVDYLNPYNDPIGKLQTTDNTVSIHWYGKSWMSKGKVLRSTITKPFHRLFGVDVFKRH